MSCHLIDGETPGPREDGTGITWWLPRINNATISALYPILKRKNLQEGKPLAINEIK
jgi:hypothetical protein